MLWRAFIYIQKLSTVRKDIKLCFLQDTTWLKYRSWQYLICISGVHLTSWNKLDVFRSYLKTQLPPILQNILTQLPLISLITCISTLESQKLFPVPTCNSFPVMFENNANGLWIIFSIHFLSFQILRASLSCLLQYTELEEPYKS